MVEHKPSKHHIATLGEGATLTMELVIKSGRGYVAATTTGKDAIGTVPVDAASMRRPAPLP